MRQFKVTERYTPRTSRATSAYHVELEKYKPVTAKEEVELARRIAEGDTEARDKLATANLRFVISVAKMYTKDPEVFNDLVSVGNIGLVEAAEKFDPSRGFKFISFAVWHIRKEMLRYLGDNMRTVRIPVNKINDIHAVFELSDRLAMIKGRDVTIDEVCEYAKEIGDTRIKATDSSYYAETFGANRSISLDEEFSNSDGSQDGSLHDKIASDSFADTGVYKDGQTRIIKILCGGLKPVEKEVVLKFHGIGNPYQLKKDNSSLGEEVGLTGERVRQIYAKSLKKMKIRAKKLKIKEEDIFS